MATATLSFDHVHLLSKDPQSTANLVCGETGGQNRKKRGRKRRATGLRHARRIYRDRARTAPAGERRRISAGLEWGVDHFGLRVQGDFDGFCGDLRGKGVTFSLEPRDFNPTTRIAFINAPDGVSIELLNRKEQL